ncbi:MAG: hypothetical protein E7626_00315 [Ruminococcaceae bacterium]|nr:hypothetical protein [Oscillospiraceae bacterium]
MNDRFKFSSKKMSAVLSISLAVILAVTVTVLTVALALQSAPEPTPLPDDTPSDQQTPTPIPDDENNANNKEDEPKDPPIEKPDDENGKNDQETVVPVPDKPVWTTPVEGYLFKGHSDEELVYSLTLGDYRTHSGIDVSAEAGSEVKCCLDGTVEGVFYDPMMGYCVSVAHEGGMVSCYKNLGENIPESVKEGAKIKSGEVIGYVGESAMVEFSDEAHLHFEILVNDVAMDPLDYISYAENPDAPENE